ncbi:hypothetical protein TRFO_24637 [Tritrichomonas foetus]|uniref:VHS domain-containing protein n=1 Tax=Tritrichomonas foetus TaxID=1144522 RepID=A0A1J4KC52_9EUKA|nr:hypothetical protein TRFO_24637 [Tritrichomonas foetus]|eukprot:OHT07238.1 hypothetical protein TRFO_24637 [Tritrichomonas foetus]
MVLRVVERIVKTGTDSINWSEALNLIDEINNSQNNCPMIFESIHQIGVHGNRQEKINCIQFVDALFKNGNQKVIEKLEKSDSILALSDDDFTNDPFIHKILCQSSDSWLDRANEQKVLDKNFLEWQKKLFSFKFSYILTRKTALKFSQDLSMIHKLLDIFSEALISAENSNDALVQEILPNVFEADQRLKEFRATLDDPDSKNLVKYFLDYTGYTIQAYKDFEKCGKFDKDALIQFAALKVPQPGQKYHLTIVQKTPEMIEKQQNINTFFDDLLDFEVPTTQTNTQSFGQQQPNSPPVFHPLMAQQQNVNISNTLSQPVGSINPLPIQTQQHSPYQQQYPVFAPNQLPPNTQNIQLQQNYGYYHDNNPTIIQQSQFQNFPGNSTVQAQNPTFYQSSDQTSLNQQCSHMNQAINKPKNVNMDEFEFADDDNENTGISNEVFASFLNNITPKIK